MRTFTGEYEAVEISHTVPSYTVEDTTYAVTVNATGWHCTCPDHTRRHRHCKHIKDVMAGKAPTVGKPRVRMQPVYTAAPPVPAAPRPVVSAERAREIMADLYGE